MAAMRSFGGGVMRRVRFAFLFTAAILVVSLGRWSGDSTAASGYVPPATPPPEY
jgi:hypothetical protein